MSIPRLTTMVFAVLAVQACLAAPRAEAAYPFGADAGSIRGELDCNGFSRIQRPLAPALPCADPLGADGRGEDNGHYLGHDEPSATFFSNAKGSGNDLQWEIVLPVERPLPATQTYENLIAFWFGLTLCVPDSYPQNPCVPDSDQNRSGNNDPRAAGSGFLEMQFYPPGHPPFIMSDSCDLVHWCAALNAFSLECNFGFSYCNPNCEEPDNFAFIQTNGVPTGPPGPANATAATFTPNGHTLMMDPGDKLRITIRDTPDGMINRIDDLTARQSGFMVAGAANGFQSLNLRTCAPRGFSYHPEFSTAKFGNFMPWESLQTNVGLAIETGHFEKGRPDGDPDDTLCFTTPLIPGCLGQDTDYDGESYRRTWPDGSLHHPTPVTVGSALGNGVGPISKRADRYVTPYATMAFETNLPGSEPTCMPSGTGCVVPPPGARFYPFFAISRTPSNCIMTYGNDIAGSTTDDFGKDAQYGSPNLAWFFGDLSSGQIPNPCLPRV